MVNLTGSALQSFFMGERDLVVPPSKHAYIHRSTKLHPQAVTKHLKTFNSNVDTYALQPHVYSRLIAHIAQVEEMVRIADSDLLLDRYATPYKGIRVDNIYTLEQAGLMGASKTYQIVVSLATKLPEMLAVILGREIDDFRVIMQNKCEEFGQDLGNVSRALCNLDYFMLPFIDLNVLWGIDSKLDIILYQLVNSPTECKFKDGDDVLDLTDKSLSAEDRVVQYLGNKLTCLSQAILNEHIEDYMQKYADKSDLFLTSKGPASLTFQAREQVKDYAPFTVQFGELGQMEVTPVQLRQGSFFIAVREGLI